MGRLELKWELGGPRNYLAGKPLHAGEVLDVELDDGSWVPARYEYHWDRRASRFESTFWIIPNWLHPDEEVALSTERLCRWPG